MNHASSLVPERLCIGVFDSGVGGVSLLAPLRALLPDARIRYLADSAHAPYGERDEAAIVTRSLRISEHLVAAGAQLLVVACNTATAAAVTELRRVHPGRPIVGIEPGLKPALARSRNGRVGVMATAATLRSARFRALLAREAGARQVHLQACVGLAAAIEHGELDDPQLAATVERHCRPLREAGVDTVALGCTHYPFARSAIEAALGPGVEVVDTSEAVAAQVARVALPLRGAAVNAEMPRVLLETTGEVARLRRFATRWLAFEFQVDAAPADL